MIWTRGASWQDSDTGHRVTAIRVGDAWRFIALGPDRAEGWDYRAWRDGEATHWSGEEPKAHYEAGERIPQPREWLGTFDTAEEARRRCEDDATQAEKQVQEHDA